MRTFLWFTVLAAGLIFYGCDSSEKPAAKKPAEQKAPAVQTPAKAEKAVAAEEEKAVTSAIATAQTPKDKVEEKVDQTAIMAEENSAEMAKEASAVTKKVVKVSEETTTTVEEQTAPIVTKAKPVAEEPVKAVQKAEASQEITLEASNGNITFTHAMHADNYDCSLCHGEGTPVAFDLSKDVAHKLCKNCHKEEGAGPTSCRACHVK